MESRRAEKKTSYCEAIREAYVYLLERYPEVFVIGQGLWSPWYVGNTMKDLDKQFGNDRILDTPICEDSTTGIAVGAGLCGYRPIVVHPRMDFMILATNQIVNQAAKWSHMMGGHGHPAVTIRSIINRGGEQGAQHSQALHGWFAHIPGLRVVMPATVSDARDLLIASVLCDDPVLFIDDRWLYEIEDELPPIREVQLETERSRVLKSGGDVTLVGCGYTTQLCMTAAADLTRDGVAAEVIDLRILNPIRHEAAIASVERTGRLLAVDGGWRTCGMAGEVIAGIVEALPPERLKTRPVRITLPSAPAPTSRPLEDAYYFKAADIRSAVLKSMA
ncbi:MAG: transketolase C-terminal domain-containing protein [Pseudomonadota bacterium]